MVRSDGRAGARSRRHNLLEAAHSGSSQDLTGPPSAKRKERTLLCTTPCCRCSNVLSVPFWRSCACTRSFVWLGKKGLRHVRERMEYVFSRLSAQGRCIVKCCNQLPFFWTSLLYLEEFATTPPPGHSPSFAANRNETHTSNLCAHCNHTRLSRPETED